MERDPIRNTAEYLAEFRADIESYINLEAVQACISAGVYERAPQHYTTYHCFVDPSGGSQDSFSICIAHNDFIRQTIVIDAVREAKPPFSPEAIVAEFSALARSYRCTKVIGDNYAKIWPVEMFAKCGIIYEQSAKPKSDLYAALLPLINSARVELLDHPRSIQQLASLERHVARGGRDSITHPPGGHDDVVNAIAGAAVIAVSKYGNYDTQYLGFQPNSDDEANAETDANSRAFRDQLLGFCNGMLR